MDTPKEMLLLKEMTIYNNIVCPRTGILFHPIDLKEWSILSVDRCAMLTDCDEDELYENDIIECSPWQTPEKTVLGILFFENVNPSTSEFNFGSTGWYKKEIKRVGNIYDNPTLAKKATNYRP
jgi:hypothetical protein